MGNFWNNLAYFLFHHLVALLTVREYFRRHVCDPLQGLVLLGVDAEDARLGAAKVVLLIAADVSDDADDVVDWTFGHLDVTFM